MKRKRGRIGQQKLTPARKGRFKQASYGQRQSAWLGRAPRMQAASGFKRALLVALSFVPHGKKNAHPNICQGTHRHAMTFPLLAQAPRSTPWPRLPAGYSATRTGETRCAAA